MDGGHFPGRVSCLCKGPEAEGMRHTKDLERGSSGLSVVKGIDKPVEHS